MRLIDAEHLKRWILARWEKTDPRSAYPLRAIDIIDQVDREDTIDAEPVRHGHWIYFEQDNMFGCSKCARWMPRNNYLYCPWCGTRMDSNDSNALEMDEVNDEKEIY